MFTLLGIYLFKDADRYYSDIFQHPITISLDRPSPTDPSTIPTEIDFYINVREKSRLLLKTGTDVGNAEGSAYVNAIGRNVFGGAESVNLNASLGTRTRSAYQASFDTPILSNPDFRWEFGGLASSTTKTWASHDEVLKGGWTKLRWLTSNGSRHELAYNGIWRQLTSLAPNASPTIRNDAGDSVKSSLTHSWSLDRRDNPYLPSRGFFSKSTLELAGWGPLKGDVGFGKAELEAQGAVPVPLPFVKGESGIALTAGVRTGLLYPLALSGEGQTDAQPSRLNDRFQLGGPTDVRGFRLSGLGPRDGPDAVGGDVYAAGSANLFVPLPRVGADKPFRLQAFITGGRLLALPSSSSSTSTSKKNDDDDNNRSGGKPSSSSSRQAGNDFKATVVSAARDLTDGWPSTSAGIGLVYAHPVARFELNFSLPLVLRQGEEGRKGLQFGVGINML